MLSDRNTFSKVLSSSLENEIKSMLEEYLHHELTIIAKEFKNEFDLKSDVDYNYCTHSKFSSIIAELKNKKI